MEDRTAGRVLTGRYNGVESLGLDGRMQKGRLCQKDLLGGIALIEKNKKAA